MKKLFTTLLVMASFILAPITPALRAAVTGTFTATITVPNAPAYTVTFPALSGGIDGTAGAQASATFQITGTTGSTTSITVNGTELLTGSVDFDTDASTTASAIASAINSNTGVSGYTAISNDDTVTLTAPAGTGASLNGMSIISTSDYIGGETTFSGGADSTGGAMASTTSSSFASTTAAAGADLALNIGSTTITLTGGDTGTQVAAAVAAAINADVSNPYTATVVNGDQISLTADTAGTAHNGDVLATDLSYNGTAEVAVFTPANVTTGETFRATIDGTDYDTTATASSSVATIVAALAPMMNAHAAVDCSQDGTAVTCTASSAGMAFVPSATVLGSTSGSLTLGPITFTSDNANTACAKAGDTVVLNFTSSQALATSTEVMIDGQSAIVTDLGGNMYSASSTLNASTTEGVLSFSISAEDTDGNTSTTASTTDSSMVTFDNTAPDISLVGDAALSVAFDVNFTDEGATTTDANATITQDVTVNTHNPGVQVVTYTASDCAGNIATTTRTVTVGAAPILGGHRQDVSGIFGTQLPPNSLGSANVFATTNGSLASAVAHILAPQTIGPAVPVFIQQVLGVSTFRFDFNLKRGMSDEAIAELQRKLEALGFYTGPDTGFFGPLTFDAVVKFQKAHGISATGLVGPQTRAQLNAM